MPLEIKVTKATPVSDWKEGDCGYDDEGGLWIRGYDGAVCICEGSMLPFGENEMHEEAIMDPNLKVTITIERGN